MDYGKFTILPKMKKPGRTMAKIPFKKSSGNVFVDIGFAPAEAAELAAKSSLIIAIKETIDPRLSVTMFMDL